MNETELIEQAIADMAKTPDYTQASATDWRHEHGPSHELPPHTLPMNVARHLAPRYPDPLTWWRGDFYRYVGAHWEVVPDAEITRWLYWQLENSYVVVGAPDKEGKCRLAPWAPNRRRVADLQHALGYGLLQRTGEAHTALALTNGVLMPSRRLEPHDPERFNLASLPFAYDPAADCPAWKAFLESTLPDDAQSQEFLGEWFGYVLSGRTSQQKMAALIGERRSGKGTIARVLAAMMGRENVAGLDLPQLGTTFGRQGLIGKSLAISGDVRWNSRTIGDAVPALLQIIGEDTVSVPRKNREDWNGRLGTRFLMMSNDTPTFNDRSGALSGRMIYVRFDQSFYGKEDIGLTDRLLAELPGILNWALDGLDRLDDRGRFTQPESGEAEAEAVRRLSDPIGAFLEDWCQIGEGESIGLDDLFGLYRKWAAESGRDRDSTTKDIFSREIRSKVKVLASERRRVNGKQVTYLRGIGSAVTNADSWLR